MFFMQISSVQNRKRKRERERERQALKKTVALKQTMSQPMSHMKQNVLTDLEENSS